MGETESTIVAAQDQAISTNSFKNKILKKEIESKCRLYKQHEEIIDHLTSGCPILAKNEYLMRHNKVCTHLHYSICKAFGTATTDKWYTHMPKPAQVVCKVALCNPHRRCTTVGRTPLDEWSAHCRDLYLTTHNIHNRATSMPLAGFKPAIWASKWSQTHTVVHVATGIGLFGIK
jgi:hypothetical protein